MLRRPDADRGVRRVEVHGHCELSEEAIADRLRAGRAADLVGAGGDFVIAARDRGRETIVSSTSGIVNYFWTRAGGGGGIFHGSTVADVLRACGRAVEWNHRALADHLVFDHPLGSDTTQAQVSRVPAGAVLEAGPDSAVPEVEVVQPDDPAPAARPDDAVEALREAVGACGEPCSLSMSGGLDSRILLAALLDRGVRPRLLLSGGAASFDRRVSTAIANRFDLELEAVAVGPERVAEGAREIVAASNGLLPATNWAGLEHLRALSETADGPVLIGFNGEFARSYYASDAGFRALAQAALPRSLLPRLLLRHTGVPLRAEEAALLHPELAAASAPEAIRERVAAAGAALPGRGALAASDEFFLTHYGRQKLSADLAAAGLYVDWRTPLFAGVWVDAVRALPRRWKLGDRLHRHTIRRLFPALLEFPDEGYGALTRNPLPLPRLLAGPGPGGPYYVDPAMSVAGPLLDDVEHHREALGDVVDPALIDKLVAELRAGRGRSQLCFKLGALARWRAQVEAPEDA